MSPAAPDPSQPDPSPSEPLSDNEIAASLQKLLARHCNQLAEHFSSIQIVATKLESDGGTRFFHQGSGDRFARRGAAKAYLRVEKKEAA